MAFKGIYTITEISQELKSIGCVKIKNANHLSRILQNPKKKQKIKQNY